MYDYISGIVAEKKSVYAVIDNNGIGYKIECSLSTIEQLAAVGKKDKVFIYFSMNDDGIRLFGFKSTAERQLFKKLTSVSRVGPKTAIAVLSTFSVKRFVNIILERDTKQLTTVPGLGKKSSERLIVELKDKIEEITGFSASDSNDSNVHTPSGEIFQEAKSALLTLGYKITKIKKVLNKISKEQKFSTAEEIIKTAIKKMYSK